MIRYISILRGINVGGKRKIKMADLKSIYADLGFYDVTTYIQSGNVLFFSKNKIDTAYLSKIISNAIFKRYGFSVPIITFSTSEFSIVAANNPFLEEDTPIEHLHLTLLNTTPKSKNVEKLHKTETFDSFVLKEKAIYLKIQGKYHQSKLTNNFFEKQLEVTATTRNWKTVRKILELIQKQ